MDAKIIELDEVVEGDDVQVPLQGSGQVRIALGSALGFELS